MAKRVKIVRRIKKVFKLTERAKIELEDHNRRVISAPNGLWFAQKKVDRPAKGEVIGKDKRGWEILVDWSKIPGWENIGRATTRAEALRQAGIAF